MKGVKAPVASTKEGLQPRQHPTSCIHAEQLSHELVKFDKVPPMFTHETIHTPYQLSHTNLLHALFKMFLYKLLKHIYIRYAYITLMHTIHIMILHLQLKGFY